MSHGPIVHADSEAAGVAVAGRLTELAAAASSARGRFALAVSGGTSPEPMFRSLGGGTWSAAAVRRWSVYWSDERLVPYNDPRSNYGQARRLWLDPSGFPAGQVHPVPLAEDAQTCADAYDRLLHDTAAERSDAALLDAVVLGVGPDGHTASLFPGSASLEVRDRWAVTEPRPGLEPLVPRVTLTLEALGRARTVLFLVCGAAKRGVLAAVLNDPARGVPAARLPAARVSAIDAVEWHVDRAAWP